MASDEGGSDTEDDRFIGIRVELADGLQYVEDIAEQLIGTLGGPAVEGILHKGKTLAERTGELLDAILRQCAYDIFSDCLRVSGQDELYQLMVRKVCVKRVRYELTTLQYRVYCKDGKGDPREILVPPHIQDRLEAQCEALQGMKNVEGLLDLMEDEGCLTAEITRRIKDQPDTKEKVKMLIDNAKNSKLYSYFVLVRFLDISQQKELMSTISEEDTKTALGRMDDLLCGVYYNLLGAIALERSELEERLGLTAREFVTLSINRDSKAVDKRGLNEAHVDQSSGKPIQLTELFSGQENKEPTKMVLLIGAPGTGKTTASMQLAREATTKKATNVPHPPFVIRLRSIDWKNHTSLKTLLLNRGPKLKEKERDDVWNALSKNADDVTIILDGADEVPGGFFQSELDPVAGEESEAPPQDILNNLISRELLKGARVLVSSRPFSLLEGWKHFNRKVDVVGFNDESLDSFLSKELPPRHLKGVQKFLVEQIIIRSLLLTPLYAASFVVRAKSTENTSDLLMQSRTELSLLLIDSLLKTKLRKRHKESIPFGELDKQGSIVWKLCNRVAELLCEEGAIKIEMTEGDLGDVSGEKCAETGLFVKRDIVEGDVYHSIFEVPHQSLLESMAAIGLGESQIKKLVVDNDGRYDLIITYVAGFLGAERNRTLLSYILSKEAKKKDFTKLAQDVVSGVFRSKRRALPGGDVFCMRIVHESQQWSLIGDLKRVMETRWLRSSRSEELMVADRLIGQDPRGDTDPPVRVAVRGLHNVRYCPRATALELVEVTAADIAANVDHLNNLISVCFYSARITREMGAELSRLHKLEAVYMADITLGSAPSDQSSILAGLASIPSLHYLSLTSCDLTSGDVVDVTSSCPRLRHLEVSGNDGLRGEDVRSEELTGLSVVWCGLGGDDIVEIARRNGQSLLFLNALPNLAMSNPVFSSSHFSALLTHCPRLRELYVDDGGELVRALSVRRAACGLNHLLLFKCDLSSSSSSGRPQVSSSMLRRVLINHPSITSLTLYACGPFRDHDRPYLRACYPFRACRHFTPRVMRDLSSSMAAITSLYISPHYDHRPPRSSDVASLIRASPRLTQFWLDDVGEWRASDYIALIRAVNASPTLCVLGLYVWQLSADEVHVVVGELTRPLTRLWLRVSFEKWEELAEVVMRGAPGEVQLVSGLYLTYVRESGSFYQHLPPSLHDYFRPDIR